MNTLRKILVVDDDPVIGKSFQRVLSRNYAVVTAKDGAEALQKIAEDKYDAVYTDIKMPGMDGIEVAKHIKATQSWLPVVIISGYATTENESRAKAAGVESIMHKPLTPEMIINSTDSIFTEKAIQETPVEISEVPKQNYTFKTWAKNVAMFAVAPFVGLAYIIALPFVGFGMLTYIGYKAAFK